MHILKTFPVFGDPVDVLVTSEMTDGLFAILVQTCAPGGGPPPHVHQREDEIFQVIEGDFALLQDNAWKPVAPGQIVVGVRGAVHTFRNLGSTVGKIMVIASPGGLDHYLEEISPLSLPQDVARITEISDRYGITFVAAQATKA
jgi:mannose-6-phosphate isomerase-like protein (cupin superfamily)